MKKNKKKLQGFIATNRAKHNLKIHLILVCKYRKKLLYKNIDTDIKQIISDIEEMSDFKETFLLRKKRFSCFKETLLLRNKRFSCFNSLKKEFWKEKTLWSNGYFVCSIREASPETIRKYIANQG